MTLGQKIRKSREKKEMSLEGLGAKVGRQKSTISLIEKDSLKLLPDPNLILRIADALEDDSILFAYLENNPVYKAVIPRVFPELNNIRPDPAAMFAKIINEAEEAVDAAKKLAEVFLRVDYQETPGFGQKFVEGMEQLLDVKRAVEELEHRLVLSQVVSRGELSDIYELQQEKCIRNGHHKPEKENEEAA